MRPGRLNLIALVALLIPHLPHLLDSLRPILHQPLHILRQALKPVILLLCNLHIGLIVFRDVDLHSLTMLSIL